MSGTFNGARIYSNENYVDEETPKLLQTVTESC